jgi:hypothetical protein
MPDVIRPLGRDDPWSFFGGNLLGRSRFFAGLRRLLLDRIGVRGFL